ncbi:Alpha/Beta hydrolase protein [Talaromyces proteolyticus]|uniref:Alpha/Beta hydrolase protein n=1 Tax=Talaromyces proteolyticus TaxID=1131652 RepID=A0AAD4KJ77_9EURO|nr:Alpha/Beta hydrolase protein [Talaromyces proteolyticus]KAH8693750.1 Alpha/Beta hydrolase protein [Talaromyces proteolyticus]
MKGLHKPAEPGSGVLERDIFFPARDGFQLRARVFEPATQDTATTARTTPLVVYYHGGGYTIGSPEDTASSCRRIVQNLGVVCIAPGYRQGPEDPFPASINDAWDALKWIASHAEAEFPTVSLSAGGFVIGGSSAGGSMSAILVHLARDEGLMPVITGLFQLASMILPPEAQAALPSRYQEMYLSRTQAECQQDPVRSPALAKIFHDSARGDPQSPMFVPFIWPKGHEGLPRTYFQVCGMDTVRDEALIYEQVLREHGVETKLDIYPGMPHIFWGTFPFLGQSKKAVLDFENGIKWLLQRTS